MKNKSAVTVIFTALLSLFFASCFSAWDGEEEGFGYVVIGGGGANPQSSHTSSRTLPAPEQGGPVKTQLPTAGELEFMRYKAVFTSPGKETRNIEFGAEGGSVRLAAGSWTAAVKAYNSHGRLRGYAAQSFQVSQNTNEYITLKAVIGVRDEAELAAAFAGTLDSGAPYLDANDNLIIIQNDIALSGTIPAFSVPAGKFILAAETGTTRRIFRQDAPAAGVYFELAALTSYLTLGRPGETGKLVIDGSSIDTPSSVPMFWVTGGGTLTVEGSTEITRCVSTSSDSTRGGGAISVHSGTLALNGGKLTGNSHKAAANAYGGAVFIYTGGRLTFGSGPVEISGNTAGAAGSSSGYGGGVYAGPNSVITFAAGQGHILIKNNKAAGSAAEGGGIHTSALELSLPEGLIIEDNEADTGGGAYIAATSLTVSGALIRENTAHTSGGGIYIRTSGSFMGGMTGGEISGNRAKGGITTGVSTKGGGGLYLDLPSSARFTVTGGEIKNNKAITGGLSYAQGGGVFLIRGIFELAENGVVSGNQADSSAGTGSARGGGIFVNPEDFTSFTLSPGGSVRGNTALANTGDAQGGGIYLDTKSTTSGGSATTYSFAGGSVTQNMAEVRAGAATASGGGAYNASGTSIVRGSTKFSANVLQGGQGGGAGTEDYS